MRHIAWLLPLSLAACGTLPQPFYGDPGVEGAKLAVPPAPVLYVPAPGAALLDHQAATLFAQDVASALAADDVPTLPGAGGDKTWRLVTTAKLSGSNVIPSYQVLGPGDKSYGTQAGAPVPAAAWANGDATALSQAAATDSVAITHLLAAVNATIQGSDPNSLENRVPRVFMGAVTGAPGDGNTSLALNMTRDLPGPDTEVVKDPARADFTVTGLIKTQPDKNGQILVELDWSVTDAYHRKIGQVTQLHDLSPQDIEPYWGDVAAAAATEAAGGVNEVISNAILHKPANPAATPAPAAGH
jgi:hypothetical protein